MELEIDITRTTMVPEKMVRVDSYGHPLELGMIGKALISSAPLGYHFL